MKHQYYFTGRKSVIVPTAAVLTELALFGTFSNRNNFIIGIAGFILLILCLSYTNDYKCYEPTGKSLLTYLSYALFEFI